jgi:hypothetical protein
MAFLLDTRTGPILQADGAGDQPLRQGRMGALVTADGHGRFFEMASRGNMYSTGSGNTALSANTITLTATSTPILGLWNPLTSGVNVLVLQAALGTYANTLTAPVPPGPFLWASSVGNSAISTGAQPLNRKTLIASGSSVKAFAGGVALTGLTNNLTVFEAADLPQLSSLTNAGTITAQTTTSNATAGAFGVQNFDGSLVIPPGGVLSLVNTNSTTTYSVAGRLLWEEVPVIS